MEIQNFLKKISSPFANVSVSNFEFESVKIKAALSVKTGYGILATQNNVNQLLKVYLSPWISDPSQQIEIYESVSAAQVVKFISGIEGVKHVDSLEFYVWENNEYKRAKDQTSITPKNERTIFITAKDHCINCEQK
jgi:hypothetical protein